ncbi:putative transcription factor interactor and regulator CCHC(Zn) family [Helianthus debilis subsp. tardiflorus]
MASVIRRAQRFMEITGRRCLGGPTTNLGFDKSKVTCFKCKQKGDFKRECSNQNVDVNENPFHDDYYRKAIYHRNNEQPPKINRSQTDEGSSKEKTQALVVTQEDEEFNWNKYIPKDGSALVAEIKYSREYRIARSRLDEVYYIFKEAKQAKRWDDERKCYLDPQGNPAVDLKSVDFDALLATIPTATKYYSKKKEDKNYEEQVEKRIKKVINASLEMLTETLKKDVEEIIDES